MSVDVLNRVASLIRPDLLRAYDDYYTGNQPIAFLPPDVAAMIGERLPAMVLNVPRVVVDSIEERLDVEGFRLARNDDADESLFDIWQNQNLDEWSQLCHIEALKFGISFATVWSGADPDTPSIAVESAQQMAVEFSPGTRAVQAAAKVWQEPDDSGKTVTRAVLYLPDSVEFYWRPGATAFLQASPGQRVSPQSSSTSGLLAGGAWRTDRVLANPLGEVPVVPFVNRPTLMNMTGESELVDVMPITDGINKLLSDMLVTSEFHAEPRRYATGMQVPREAQNNQRLAEQVKQEWQDAARGKFLVAGAGVQFGQFTAANLDNFISAVNMLLGKAAFLSGLPPHMLGVNSDNPASAEAIRASEASLVRRARRKQRGFGGSWERVMRLALKVQRGTVPAQAFSMETIWADPETSTFAQDADAVTKLTGGTNPIISRRAAQEILGLTPAQIKRIEEEFIQQISDLSTFDVTARIQQARELMLQDNLSQKAAYAAVGLLAAANEIPSGLANNGVPASTPSTGSGASTATAAPSN